MLSNFLRTAIRERLFDANRDTSVLARTDSGGVSAVPTSLSVTDNAIIGIVSREGERSLAIMTPREECLRDFSGEAVAEHDSGRTYYGLVCDMDHHNALALRALAPRTAPSVLTGPRSFGFGDRIGGEAAATSFHLAACSGYDLAPVPAQQSVRENTQTGRCFADVLDDATWAVLETGFDTAWGADADHLKEISDLEEAARAGFTFYTIDPSDALDAAHYDDEELAERLARLVPADSERNALVSRYERHVDGDTRAVVRSLVTHLPAVRFAVTAYRRLEELLGADGFAFELSVDETDIPTTILDHRIVAEELAREDVRLYSLAPRYVGSFEKGIDFVGDVDEFRRSLAGHASLARELGDYRLSLHSGSDKFSIYPAFGEITDGRFHVKTAGTSFLEAVKTIAAADTGLYRDILALAIDTFHDNASHYQISADVSLVPDPATLETGTALDLLTNDTNTRQVIHIAYGVILDRFDAPFRAALATERDRYGGYLLAHLGHHLELLTGR